MFTFCSTIQMAKFQKSENHAQKRSKIRDAMNVRFFLKLHRNLKPITYDVEFSMEQHTHTKRVLKKHDCASLHLF